MERREIKTVGEILYSYTHSSGVKVYMVPKPGFSKAAAYFSTHFGSIDNHFVPVGEKDAIQVPDGVAHFLEHKMFEQPDGANVFDQYSKFGAYANAYTSFHMTAYYFWCTEHLKENIKTLVEFVQTPYFTEENVAKEQGIIGQEIRMYEDDPQWRCYFNMLQGLYQVHPVSKDIAGTVESIAEITKDTLYTCYHTFYHPSNMALCIVGDFVPEEMQSYVNGLLKDIPQAPPVERFYPQEPEQVAQKKITQKLSVARPIYSIGFKDQPRKGAEAIRRRVAVKAALNLLMGRSSKLYNELYEKGLITPGFSFDYSGEEAYAFTEISDECDHVEKVVEAIEETIRAFEFQQEDFERIKRKMFGNSLYALDDPEEYINELAQHVTMGFDPYLRYEACEKLTMEDVQDVLDTHLKPENMTVSIVLPQE